MLGKNKAGHLHAQVICTVNGDWESTRQSQRSVLRVANLGVFFPLHFIHFCQKFKKHNIVRGVDKHILQHKSC